MTIQTLGAIYKRVRIDKENKREPRTSPCLTPSLEDNSAKENSAELLPLTRRSEELGILRIASREENIADGLPDWKQRHRAERRDGRRAARKSNGGLRPIAMGEAFYKLSCLYMLSVVRKDIPGALGPMQFALSPESAVLVL